MLGEVDDEGGVCHGPLWGAMPAFRSEFCDDWRVLLLQSFLQSCCARVNVILQNAGCVARPVRRCLQGCSILPEESFRTPAASPQKWRASSGTSRRPSPRRGRIEAVKLFGCSCWIN